VYLFADLILLGYYWHYLGMSQTVAVHTISEYSRKTWSLGHKILLMLCLLTSNALLMVHLQNYLQTEGNDKFQIVAITGDLLLLYTGIFPTYNQSDDKIRSVGHFSLWNKKIGYFDYDRNVLGFFYYKFSRALHLIGVLLFILFNTVFILADIRCVINLILFILCVCAIVTFAILLSSLDKSSSDKIEVDVDKLLRYKLTVMSEFVVVFIVAISSYLVSVFHNDYTEVKCNRY